MKRIPCSEIVITIDHPLGEVMMPLTDWMEQGPGVRPLLSPSAAWCKSTRERLPLYVIPLAYRNIRLSRLLIGLGFLKNPWAVRPIESRK